MSDLPREPLAELSGTVQASLHRFLEAHEPLRGDLYRYCRFLTRSAWDAEDLAAGRHGQGLRHPGPHGAGAAEPQGLAVRHADGEAVRSVNRVDTEDGRIARIRHYFFTPDIIAEVCQELGLPYRINGYRNCNSTP